VASAPKDAPPEAPACRDFQSALAEAWTLIHSRFAAREAPKVAEAPADAAPVAPACSDFRSAPAQADLPAGAEVPLRGRPA